MVGVLLSAGCATPAPDSLGAGPAETPPEGLPLISDEWEIVEMATAHGAFTIEVEVATDTDTDALARQLVEPLKPRYAEVLVYFYDREDDGGLPMVRIQWTAADGYVETRY